MAAAWICRSLVLYLSIFSFSNAFNFASTFMDSILSTLELDPRSTADPVHMTSNNSGTYIRVALMNDSSLLAGYTASIENDTVNALKTARSTDNGQSWSLLGEVYRGPVETHDIDNAMPIQLPSGRVLYAYRNHDRTGTGPDDHYTYYRISMSYSDDGGKTFKFLSQVDERAENPAMKNGLWEPFLRLMQNGTLQCYYSSENQDNDQDSLMRYSNDGGQTWSPSILVSGGNITSRDGMQGVAPLYDNGTLIAVFEETETGPFEISAVVSHDDGMVWGERRKVYKPPQGIAGAPQVCNVGGNIVVSFMTTEDHAGIDGGVDGGDMKVIVSQDAGTSWGPSFTTGPAPAHWPGVFTLDSSHFMALYAQTGQGALSQIYILD